MIHRIENIYTINKYGSKAFNENEKRKNCEKKKNSKSFDEELRSLDIDV